MLCPWKRVLPPHPPYDKAERQKQVPNSLGLILSLFLRHMRINSVVASQGSIWCSCSVLQGQRCRATVSVTLIWDRILVTPVPMWTLSTLVLFFSCVLAFRQPNKQGQALETANSLFCSVPTKMCRAYVSTLGIRKKIALVRKNEAWYSPRLHYL